MFGAARGVGGAVVVVGAGGVRAGNVLFRGGAVGFPGFRGVVGAEVAFGEGGVEGGGAVVVGREGGVGWEGGEGVGEGGGWEGDEEEEEEEEVGCCSFGRREGAEEALGGSGRL